MRHFVVMLLALAFTGASVAQEPTPVAFPGADLTLTGVVYRPSGPGPHPAVVALHGCGGLYSRDGRPSPRHADWGERLAAQGYLVLFPDSFGSRGLGSQCTVRDRTIRPGRERAADAVAALRHLQSLPDVKRDAIALLGWSNGGSTVLRLVARGRKRDAGLPDFSRAVAFYPGCRSLAEGGSWASRIPLMILIGDADDWTPIEPCRELAARPAGGAAVELVVYPGALHDFDHPNLPRRQRTGLAFTRDGAGVATIGTDPKARADAIDKVSRFLSLR